MRANEAKAIAKQVEKIGGWFSTQAAMLFALLDEIQRENEISGEIFEIGCHHGKSTVLLGAISLQEKKRLAVCDLFGDQETNVSASGCGDREIFERNMSKHIAQGLQMEVFQQNSAALKPEEIGGPFRFFHVDGGHNCDEALGDIELGAATLHDAGVIVVDDPFRPEWPGVTEAVIRFLDQNDEYCSLLVGFNKMVLVKKAHAEHYKPSLQDESLLESYGLGHPWRTKELPFHTGTLTIFHVPTYIAGNSLKSLAVKYYRKNPWMKQLLSR